MSKIIKTIEKFRSIQNGGQRSDVEFHEPLNRDLFAFSKVVRHGFPHGPTCMAFDPIQRLLAIANQCGTIQIFGRSGVKSVLKKIDQSVDQPVTQIQFLVNEGALISVTADNKIHLWNFRQKQPEVTQSLEFGSREPISCIFVPFQSKWLYVGSEKGNVFIVSIETFALSGYDIKWNRAVGVGQPTHPGGVIHLSDAPWDDNKLLIGFEKGTIVLWDLKEKMGERFQCEQYVRSISWMYEGKQFVCSHPDGSLSLWNIKTPEKAERIWMPHYKKPSPTDSDKENNRIERCKPVNKIEWKHFRNGDEIMVFYDGTIMSDPKNKHIEPCPCVTVQKGKSTCVLQMEYPIVTFLTLCESPYATEPQEPYAVAVLLKNDLVLVDLTSTSYPSFENPYQMDIAESPVTFCKYVADFPSQFVYELFTSQPKIKNNKNVSSKPWPITGGKGSVFAESYHELIITGHLDGTLKFWEAPGLTLQILYKLKTAKHFEKPDDVDHAAIIGSFPDGTAQSVFENLFAVEEISFCIPSRTLAVAGRAGQVMVYRFSRTEKDPELITHLNVPMVYKLTEEDNYIVQVPLGDYGQVSSAKTADAKRQETIDVGNGPPSPATSEGSSSEFFYPVKVKGAAQKFNSGYHIDLVCITPWGSADTPESAKINVLCLNSSFGLLAYACQQGLAVIDYVQRCIILSMSAASLYGSNDPYAHHRAAVNLKHGGSSFERQNTMDDQLDEPSGVSGQDRTESISSPVNTIDFIEEINSLIADNDDRIRFSNGGILRSAPPIGSPVTADIETIERFGSEFQRCGSIQARVHKDTARSSEIELGVEALCVGARLSDSDDSSSDTDADSIDKAFAEAKNQNVTFTLPEMQNDPIVAAAALPPVAPPRRKRKNMLTTDDHHQYNNSNVNKRVSTEDEIASQESGVSASTSVQRRGKSTKSSGRTASKVADWMNRRRSIKLGHHHHPVEMSSNSETSTSSVGGPGGRLEQLTVPPPHSPLSRIPAFPEEKVVVTRNRVQFSRADTVDLSCVNNGESIGPVSRLRQASLVKRKTSSGALEELAPLPPMRLSMSANTLAKTQTLTHGSELHDVNRRHKSKRQSFMKLVSKAIGLTYDNDDDDDDNESSGTKSKSTVTSASASAVTRNSRALMLKAKSFASSSGPPLSSSSLAHLPTEEDHQNLLCPTLSLLDRNRKFQQSASVDPPLSSGQQTTDLKPPPSEMTRGPSPPLSASMIPRGKLGFTFHRSQDKEFSHSRSNSTDDLESIRSEAVSLIQFHESCARKNESQMYPSIWIGTTAGSVMSWCIMLPSCDCRLDEKVVLAPSGTIIQQKGGSVICQGLYSMNNQILQPIAVPSVPWENLSKSKPKNLKAAGGCSTSSDDCVAPWGDGAAAPSSSGQQADSQYLVVCTETKLCCYGVPSMTCVNSVKTSDIGLDPHPSVILWKAELCKIQQIAYLACFCSNAHILALSLPSFRCVFDEKMLPHADLRVAKFTSFADCGIGVYMCTPSELQKFTMSVEMSRQLGDMMSEVFMAVESPPAPKPSFFKGFFAQTAALDREELFRPGSQPKSVATMVKSATGQSATGQLDGARGYAASSSNVVNDARDKLFERGDKLKDTEDATQRMMESANSLSNNARQMKEHFKKKWYQF